MSIPISNSELIESLVNSPAGVDAWCSGFAHILDEDSEIVPLTPNPLQRDVLDAYQFCLNEQIPCRLILLKARKKGCSTISNAILTHYMRTRPKRFGKVVGGEYDQARVMLRMLETYIAEDAFQWPDGAQVVDNEARFGNGSSVLRGTANDKEEGRADTLSFVTCTEIARWDEDGVSNATDVVTGLSNAVPERPDTVVILESTAKGPAGVFYQYWQDAVDWSDVKAGRVSAKGKYIRIFSPWHVHANSWAHDMTGPELDALRRSMTTEERVMQVRYNLDLRQIEWRRRIIRTKCKRDPKIFQREYPFTVEEAFSASSPSVFNAEALTFLEGEAHQATRHMGCLDSQAANPDVFAWRKVTEEDEAFFWLWEFPKPGARYLIAVDVMTGLAQDEKGDDRDHHVALVIRPGFRDQYGKWNPIRVVARTKTPCQWDIDILAQKVFALSQYYGGCMVVPEENMDRGLIRMLHHKGVMLYEQKTGDRKGNLRSSTGTGKFGYRTTGGGVDTAGVRAWMIENLAARIREWDTPNDGIDIPCLALLDELRTFVRDLKGRESAMPGKHDDAVMALCIALACIENATLYTESSLNANRRAVDPMIKEELMVARQKRRIAALRGFS